MKNLTIALSILICCSCTAKVPNDEQLQTKRLMFNKMYYWNKSTDGRFFSISFDSLTSIQGRLYTNEQTGKLEEKKFVVNKLIDNKYELLDLKTKKVGGTLSILSDSSMTINFSSDPNTSLTMVADVTFERMFNHLKSKNNFKCISSNEISYNNIVCYKTSVNSYLSNPGYKSKTEQIEDEVYGKEEKKYLDNNGNKYYYSVKDGNNFFYKIELINAKTLSPYLGINVGDRMSRVKETLSSQSIVFTESKSSLRVRVCNAMFEGAFGSLLYKFEETDKKDADKSLINIIYTPLNEE